MPLPLLLLLLLLLLLQATKAGMDRRQHSLAHLKSYLEEQIREIDALEETTKREQKLLKKQKVKSKPEREHKLQVFLEEKVYTNPLNRKCADCTAFLRIPFASTNLGILLCADCAEVHRLELSNTASIALY